MSNRGDSLLITLVLLTFVCSVLRYGVQRRAFIKVRNDKNVYLTEKGQLFAVVCATTACIGVVLIDDAFAALAWACASTLAPLLTLLASLPPPTQRPVDSPYHDYYARYVDRHS